MIIVHFEFISAICNTMKGKTFMKTFDNKDFENRKQEVKEKWGKTEAYKEHCEKTRDYSDDKWNTLAEAMDGVLAEFALCLKSGKASDSDESQFLVKKLQKHITDNYYNCTNEILAGLGQMYVADERFRNNIDKHGEGTAEFIRDAIDCCCSK